MRFAIKIRGVYTTALTRFFLDRGADIVSPSRITAERFENPESIFDDGVPDIEISDMENKQGVVLDGLPDAVDWTVEEIKDAFLDAIFRRGSGGGNLSRRIVSIEFPYFSKTALDELRNRVVPTVECHHRLRLIVPDYLDLIEEKDVASHPEKRNRAGRNLIDRFIWKDYEKGKQIDIEHVKLGGKTINLSPGEIMMADRGHRRLVLKRTRFSGKSRYDGLEIEKAPNDYAISEVTEGEWFYTHTYFRADGERIGTYYNISTPVEFYPDKIRYVDLEIDVVGWPGGEMGIVDVDELELFARDGFLRQELRDQAIKVAQELVEYP